VYIHIYIYIHICIYIYIYIYIHTHIHTHTIVGKGGVVTGFLLGELHLLVEQALGKDGRKEGRKEGRERATVTVVTDDEMAERKE
jgi:hypothetical protein